MIRRIIKIDEGKCDGCGLCADACHEGAIGLVGGKAKLLRDDYCDGLGDCLPVCPTGAISFEEREAAGYDEAAVKAKMNERQPDTLACGCPGTHSKSFNRESVRGDEGENGREDGHESGRESEREVPGRAAGETQLNQWPVQIKLVPPSAPYFNKANLLIAADCSAYAYGGFHDQFMKNRITIIGCPKLDDVDYSEKLTAILKSNEVKSVTIVRMEVPCCGGIEHAAKIALQNCGKMIPWQVVTISTDGKILE